MATRQKLLVVLTSQDVLPTRANMKMGWYLPELFHPYNDLTAYIDLIVASPKGGVAPIDPYSIEDAKDDEACQEFLKEKDHVWKYTHKLESFLGKSEEYIGIFFVGGHGPMFDPAVLGTTSVLGALHQTCPTVQRVALTSSFAAILDPKLSSTGAKKTYTEADWSPLTLEDAYANAGLAYAASKAFAEKAAWDFVASNKPKFSLTTICPPMIYGPVKYPIKSLDSVHTSNQLLADIINGKNKNGLPPTQLPLWIDVRDVALAHVKAMETEEAAGKRIFVTGGYYSNEQLYGILHENFPELRDRLPDDANKGGDPNPALKSFGYDATRANTILGIEWTLYKKSVIDSVKSLLKTEQ